MKFLKTTLAILLISLTFNVQGQTKIDTTFGEKGFRHYDFGGNNYAAALLTDAEDIYACVVNINNGRYVSRIIKFKEDGQHDSTFSGDGVLELAQTGGRVSISALAKHPDSSIVAVGWHSAGFGGADVYAAKFSTKGVLDANFGTAGKKIIDLNGTDIPSDVIINDIGQVSLYGYQTSGVINQAFSLLLSATGSLISTYGNGGISFFDFGNYTYFLNAIEVENKAVLVCGGTDTLSSTYGLIAKIDSSGKLDKSFESDGKVLNNHSAGVTKSAVLGFTQETKKDTGFIWLYEETLNGKTVFYLGKNLRDGVKDSSFGTDGRVLLTPGAEGAKYLGVQTRGNVVVAFGHFNFDGTIAAFDIKTGRQLDAGLLESAYNLTSNRPEDVRKATSPLHIKKDSKDRLVVLAQQRDTSTNKIEVFVASVILETKQASSARYQTSFSSNARIIPNPSAGLEDVTIELELKSIEDLKLSISDVTGKQLEMVEFNSLKIGTNLLNISASYFPNKGFYFVHITSSKGTKTLKLLRE